MNERFAEAVGRVVQEYRNFEEALERKTPPDMERTLAAFITVVDALKAEAARDPARAADYRFARDALVYWIDEMLCVHCRDRWPHSNRFRDRCLERHYQRVEARETGGHHGAEDHPPDGGNLFYERAEVAKTLPETDALETFLLCVTLGFEGRLHRESRRQEWVDSVHKLLKEKQKAAAAALERSKPRGPAPPPASGPSPLYGQHFRLGVAVVVAVTALTTLAGFIAAVHLMPY